MGAPGSLSAAKLPQTPGDPQAAGLEGARAAQVAREDGRGQRPGRSLCGPRKQLCALVFGDHTTGGREETGGDPALGRARPTHAATASSGRGRKATRAPRRAQGPHGAWGREGRPAAPVLVVRSSVSSRHRAPAGSRVFGVCRGDPCSRLCSVTDDRVTNRSDADGLKTGAATTASGRAAGSAGRGRGAPGDPCRRGRQVGAGRRLVAQPRPRARAEAAFPVDPSGRRGPPPKREEVQGDPFGLRTHDPAATLCPALLVGQSQSQGERTRTPSLDGGSVGDVGLCFKASWRPVDNLAPSPLE